MIEYADVIVDLSYGDTGKGKVTNLALQSKEYDLVVRYNGGSNAGHTFYHGSQKIVTHQVPIGVIYGIPSIIGPGTVVNLDKLEEELAELRRLGVWAPEQFLYVDFRATVVEQTHLDEDAHDTAIGTTKQGIGPAYRDRVGRVASRIADLDMMMEYPRIQVTDIYSWLHVGADIRKVLCEGAQGFYLDNMWGDYPYVTSSHCTVASAIQNGIPYNKIRNVFGVAKAYETYVGNKTNFVPTDQQEYQKLLDIIGDVGKEYGATTGRRRKVRFLDLDELIKAVNVNGVTHLIINKMDVLDTVNLLPIAHNRGSVYQFVYDSKLCVYKSPEQFRDAVVSRLQQKCPSLSGQGRVETIKFAYGER